MDGGLRLWPEGASNFAGPVDSVYIVLILLSALFTIPIVALIIYFSIKYRRGAQVNRTKHSPGLKMEMAWIAGLLLLVVPVYVWSAGVYVDMFRPPREAMEIYVVGRQWMWKIQHPNGRREINELHVPLGRPVRLIMTSQDVIHSFYVPAFRVKYDVIPGRYTELWFEPTREGVYHLFCAEYCGTEHSGMIGRVIVMPPREYQTWLAGADDREGIAAPDQAPESMAEVGRLLFEERGCVSCHRADGTGPGPPLTGVFGSQVRLANGETVVADENYIRTSILDPNAQIVAGYEPIMPSYEGQFTEEELTQMIEYIRSLGDEGVGDPPENDAPENDGTTDGAGETPEGPIESP